MYKVIADSSNEVDSNFSEKYPTEIVPFKLYLDNIEYVDDENFDVDSFVDKMGKSKNLPKTACPSPNDFLEKFYGDSEEIYGVTISSQLSGTYNSAMLAKQIYESENNKAKFIHIFDSKAASAGETLVTKMIHEYKKANLNPEALVEKVEAFIKEMQVYFISESLDNLIKNGRLSKFKGILATTLSIVPIMGTDSDGEIKLFERVRNKNKAYQRLIEIVKSEVLQKNKKTISITHVGNPERVEQLKKELLKIKGVEDIICIKCAGLSSLYADNKGVIVAF